MSRHQQRRSKTRENCHESKVANSIRKRRDARATACQSNAFGSLHREIDRLFEDFTRGRLGMLGGQGNLMPSIDVSENDKEIEIAVELPGLERKDVEISIDDDVLTIRGEKKVEEKKEDKNKNYHVTERGYGVFYRALQLPPGVDPSKVQATMSNGVLKITIPKPARSQAEEDRGQGSRLTLRPQRGRAPGRSSSGARPRSPRARGRPAFDSLSGTYST